MDINKIASVLILSGAGIYAILLFLRFLKREFGIDIFKKREGGKNEL